MLLRIELAQKLLSRACTIFAFLGLVGCPQQVKPPVTEVGQATTQNQALLQQEQPPASNQKNVDDVAEPPTVSDQASSGAMIANASNESPKVTVIPEQPNWNKSSREIARTELSPKSEASPVLKVPTINESNNVTALPANSPIRSIDESSLSQKPIELASEQINRQNPKASIRTLDRINLDRLTETERADVLRIKARAHRQMDMQISALRFEAERLKYLTNPALNAAARSILGELESLKGSSLLDISSGNDQLAGLASAINLKNSEEPEAISEWLRKYRIHPLLRADVTDYSFLIEHKFQSNFRITALLPLSGQLANAGRAIRDGMLFEFQRRKGEIDLNLQILDTEKLSGKQLISLGQSLESEFLIGPLQKDRANTLLESKPKMPVLVLNRVQISNVQLNKPAYSLSLSIEDDAESAVEQIARKIKRPRITTLYTDSSLGLRAAKAIAKKLELIGGSNGGQFALDAKKPELAIIQAFGVADSESRRRKLVEILGLRLKLTPRIRQDMSSVVLHTDPKKAQQIRPLLDFYYLDNTPVYVIGAFRHDLKDISEDLQHTNLVVTPWDLNSSGKIALAQRPLAQGVLSSLIAIGIDAMDVTLRLGFGMPTFGQGQTGYLSLGNDSMINRQLSEIEISKSGTVTPFIWLPTPTYPKVDIFDAQ